MDNRWTWCALVKALSYQILRIIFRKSTTTFWLPVTSSERSSASPACPPAFFLTRRLIQSTRLWYVFFWLFVYLKKKLYTIMNTIKANIITWYFPGKGSLGKVFTYWKYDQSLSIHFPIYIVEMHLLQRIMNSNELLNLLGPPWSPTRL